MRHELATAAASVVLTGLLSGTALAATAQVELTIVDEQGRPIREGLVMFARVDDASESFTISEDEAGRYSDAVTVPAGRSAWRVMRVVVAGYLPTKVGIRSTSGNEVAQDVQGMELGPAAPIPEITLVAGGTTRIDLTLGERKAVLERQARARAEAEPAEPESPAAPAMDAAYATALRLYGEGDPVGALPHFEQAARDNPDSVEIHVTYANVLYQAKRYEQFEKVARRALELKPDHAELWMMVYSSARARGDMRAARDALLAAKQAGGGGPALLQHLDFVARKLGSDADAVPLWEAILELEPTNADACIALASLHSDQGDRGRSDEYLARAVRLAPRRAPELYLNMGTKLAASKRAGTADLDRAIEMFREAIRLDPGLALAYRKLGLALWKKEDWPATREALEKYLELVPNAEDEEQIRDYIGRLPE